MERLDKLQKHAVRIITRSKYNFHTDPLFRKLNLLKSKDLFELNVLKLFYQYKKKSSPFYLSNMFSNFTSSHGYELRTTYILKDVVSNMSSGNKCIRHYLPVVINDLKNDILNKIETHFLYGFVFYIKIIWCTHQTDLNKRVVSIVHSFLSQENLDMARSFSL